MDQQPHQPPVNKINRLFVYPSITRIKIGNKPAILIMALFALVLSGNAYAGDATRHYQIPAQSLNNALMRFAAESNLELVFTADQVRGMTANRLEGDMTAAQALTQLLQGSGMTYRYINAHSITLEQQPGSFRKTATAPDNPEPQSTIGEGQVMPKVTVEADAAYDPEYYADPYNKDYVLPNATAGTKTDTPIMETPLNVQVISKQVLKDQQVIRLADSFKNVSGVVTRTNTAGAGGILGGLSQGIFLRGFESQTFFRNGFRLQEGSASKGLANVESVEVLKGPAAILYGLVEPGGMVNVITKQPLATPYYGFTQQFGSYDLYRTTFDATGPIGNNKDVLYRANLSYENSSSFRDFVGTENVFFAPVLKWNISPKTQVTFELEYNHQLLGTDPGFIPFLNGRPINMLFSRNYGEYSPATTETIFGGFNWSHQFNDDWTIKHRFSVNQNSLAAPFYTRAQIAGTKEYIQGRLDEGGIAHPALDKLPDGSYVWRDGEATFAQSNTYSTNLDLIGHFDTYRLKHTLLIGGDYYRLDSKSSTAFDLGLMGSYVSLYNPVHPGTPMGPLISEGGSSNKTDQYGLYIQDQIKLPYGFQVMGGIRYQYIDQNKVVQDAVTPRVGILWQPQKWLSLYANYAESFGANSGKVFPGTPVPPTSAQQYEGGIKAEFFDGKLRANLAYYDLTKTNVAVGDPLHKAPLCDFFIGCSIALGEVRSRGPELDITGEILPGWNVIATWANTDIIVAKTNADNTPISASYKPGDRLPNVPRNIGRLWSTYEVQDGDYKGLTFGGGVNLRDRQLPADDAEVGTAGYKLPGYATFDLMAGYSRNFGDAKVSLQLNVNNLLDKRYFNSLTGLSSQHGAWVDFGTPRTFMGQLSVQY